LQIFLLHERQFEQIEARVNNNKQRLNKKQESEEDFVPPTTTTTTTTSSITTVTVIRNLKFILGKAKQEKKS
jgi:hypothetical protein